MTRWAHHHTFVVGALAGFYLAHGPLLIVAFIVVAAAGVLAGRFWASLALLVRRVGGAIR